VDTWTNGQGAAPPGPAPSGGGEAKPRKKRGCFATGCLSLLVVLLLIVVFLGGVAGFVCALPRLIAPTETIEMVESPQVLQEWTRGLQAMSEKLAPQLQAATSATFDLEISEEVFNALLAAQFKTPMQGVPLEGARVNLYPGAIGLAANFALPTAEMPFPEFLRPSRVGVTVKVALAAENGVLRATPKSVKLGHLRLPVGLALRLAGNRLPPLPGGMKMEPSGTVVYTVAPMKMPDTPFTILIKSLRVEQGKLVATIMVQR
jgi:hypothetical protein